MNNPFAPLVQTIREDSKSQQTASYRLGTVKTISPLVVDVAGTDQDNTSLLKNSNLTSFVVGDRLLLIPIEDEQRYIILCKVVSI